MPEGLRVLVCGGRNYNDAKAVEHTLNDIHTQWMIGTIITGGASGADRLAELWAYGPMQVIREAADWKTHGRGAGPIRNQRMIDIHKPQLVIAFPGGKGTADMVRRARAAAIPVVEVGHDSGPSEPSP